MKSTSLNQLLLGVFLLGLWSCHKLQPVDPQPEPEPEPSQYLKQVIEAHYTPKYSLTTIYSYNAKGQLLEEKYSGLPGVWRTYSLYSYTVAPTVIFIKNDNLHCKLIS